MVRQLVDTSASPERRLRMTYEEWLAWADEDTHAEWVDGEVIVFMPVTDRHQTVLGFVSVLVWLFTNRLGLGRVMFEPFEMCLAQSARLPDLLFVAREHLDRLEPTRLAGPADLVVEVISDDSVRRDRVEKFAEYAAAGVPEYWLLDPRPDQEWVKFYALTPERSYEEIMPDAAGRLVSRVLPGFWLDPTWLWQDPPPDPVALIETMVAG